MWIGVVVLSTTRSKAPAATVARPGEALFPEATFDPKVHGRQLAESVAGMHELVGTIDEAKRRRDEALLEKRAAMKEHDRLYLRTARMFEELCRHAGKDELAERVRPSPRRSGRRTSAASEPIVVRESREDGSASRTEARGSVPARLTERGGLRRGRPPGRGGSAGSARRAGDDRGRRPQLPE